MTAYKIIHQDERYILMIEHDSVDTLIIVDTIYNTMHKQYVFRGSSRNEIMNAFSEIEQAKKNLHDKIKELTEKKIEA